MTSDATPPSDDALFDRIADALQAPGYLLLDELLPEDMLEALLQEVTALGEEDLRRAGIGREREHQHNRAVRTDQTHWLDHDSPAAAAFLQRMEQLRVALNRRLFLGLFDYEAHYARYATGAYYRKHRDAFADGRSNRVLSTVLYLNPRWDADDGGEIVLYDDDGQRELARVAPARGRLLIFLSERFPHEVLPTRRTRYSIAGWFRINNSLDGRIDPAR